LPEPLRTPESQTEKETTEDDGETATDEEEDVEDAPRAAE